MDGLQLFIPLRKVDEAQRTVYGWVDETPDHAREIMDYAKAKPRFEAWSKAQNEASLGKSFGNVRAMHGKIAAGVIPAPLEFDDVAKRISFYAKITDDAEWQKCATGTYTGFSPGGSYGDTWPDPIQKGYRRYEPVLTEMSIVDKPCIPSATFQFIKADGIEEERHFASLEKFEPSNEDVKALAEEMAKAGSGRRNDYVGKARAELIKRHAEAPEMAVAKPETTVAETGGVAEKADPADALRAALEKAGAAKPYGDVEYADPKAGKYPIDTPAHIRAAWSYVNMPKNAAKLDDADAVKAKIIAAWKKKIDPDGPPSAEKMAAFGDLAKDITLLKAVEAISLEKGFYTVGRVAHALDCVAEIASAVVWEECAEQDSDSTLPQSGLDLVASLRSFLIDMVNEETAEFMDAAEKAGGDGIALLAPSLDVDMMELAAKVGELHKADTALMEKVGAKISSANMKHVQAMHDHAQAMGATCDAENLPDGAEKMIKADWSEVETLRGLATQAAEALTKVAQDRETDRAELDGIKSTLGKFDVLGGVDVALRIIEKVSHLPEPARGRLFAVEKDGEAVEIETAETKEKTPLQRILALPEGPERAAALQKFSGRT